MRHSGEGVGPTTTVKVEGSLHQPPTRDFPLRRFHHVAAFVLGVVVITLGFLALAIFVEFAISFLGTQ